MSEIVRLNLLEKSYDIAIGSGLIKQAGSLIFKVTRSKKLIVITDKNIATHHLKNLLAALAAFTVEVEIISAGEASKSFTKLEELAEKILAKNIDRKTCLLAYGGGVIGDLTGFLASILLRGIDFVQIPTTLLSMVDSSVGGKTGINSQHGKNLIGSFYQPRLVIADIDLLQTLPKGELLAGYAEIVKYGLINDAEFFNWLDEKSSDIFKTENIIRMVQKSVKSKAAIVARDEKESGERALLNLGHTFGHAFETHANYSGIIHGEAVALGLVLAFEFSAYLGLCPKDDVLKIKNHFSKIGLETDYKKFPALSNISAGEIVQYMYKDKKTSSGKLTLILANSIGRSFIATDVDAQKLTDFLSTLGHK